MKDFRLLLNESGRVGIFKHFKSLHIGEYNISIQGSTAHYCEPQEFFNDSFKYKTMEVAVIKNNQFVDIEKDNFFNEWKDKEKFLEHYDTQVAGCIPIKIIQSLCDYVEEKSND